jgi:hypothetical protein
VQPQGFLWNWSLAVQQVCSNSSSMTIWLRCSHWARAKSMVDMISACFWLWLCDHSTFPGIHEWEICASLCLWTFLYLLGKWLNDNNHHKHVKVPSTEICKVLTTHHNIPIDFISSHCQQLV